MQYPIIAMAALVVSAQPMVQACDTVGQGELIVAPTDGTACQRWPACTTWSIDSSALAVPLAATAASREADSVDVLIGEYDLSVTGEFVRVYLERGQIYRVEFSSRGGVLDIRPRDRTAQQILPLTIEDFPRASGTRAIEIAPRADGDYEFRALGSGQAGARLRIYREIRPSARWQRLSKGDRKQG